MIIPPEKPEPFASLEPAPIDRAPSSGFASLCKSLKKWDFKPGFSLERYDEGKPRLVEVAMVALLIDPKAADLKDPGPLIRKAAKFVDEIAQHLPFGALSSAQMRARKRKDIEEDTKQRHAWKLDVKPHMQFSDFLKIGERKHKTERELVNMLTRVGFHPLYLKARIITEAAYQLALTKDSERRKKLASERKQKSRANQSPEPNK
jgi:hypothetical protein